MKFHKLLKPKGRFPMMLICFFSLMVLVFAGFKNDPSSANSPDPSAVKATGDKRGHFRIRTGAGSPDIGLHHLPRKNSSRPHHGFWLRRQLFFRQARRRQPVWYHSRLRFTL